MTMTTATTTATTVATVATVATTTSPNRASDRLVEADVSPILFKRLSDESLGSRLASGEAAAFDELYRRYVHRLSAYGAHLLGDAASGDDVAQTALFNAYAALRDGRVPDKMKPWLFRIAHNAAIDLVARRREVSSENVPERQAADREPFAGALIEALATLPDRQRRVYVLREVNGLRIDETATELGLSSAQVEQSLFAARNRLAEQLVFGDRLNCVSVQRLAAGPLDMSERRALKTHLRACGDCREALGLRGRALSFFPGPLGFEWLRGLGVGLIGGGAPAAAKVGAVFATATIAAGVPVAVETTKHHHSHRAALHLIPVTSGAPAAAAGTASRSSVAVEAVAFSPARAVAHRSTSSHDTGEQRSGPAQSDRSGSGSSGEDGSAGKQPDDNSTDNHDSDNHDSGNTDSDKHGSGDTGSERSASGDDGSSGSGERDATSSRSGKSLSGDQKTGSRHGTTAPAATEAETKEHESTSGHGSGDGSKPDDRSGDDSKSGSGSDDHPADAAATSPTTAVVLPPVDLPPVSPPD
jgi:RNA polymerase sigma factor (sigma-70 family)